MRHTLSFAPPPVSPELAVPPAPRSVLVVDDDPLWLRAASRLFASEGFAVETATNASSALRTIRQRRVDLVVSDLDMPRMDGLELRDAMLAKGDRPIPFILVSGATDDASRSAAEGLGVAHVLEKTGPVAELARLAKSLAGAHA